jgi:hypothetical protein
MCWLVSNNIRLQHATNNLRLNWNIQTIEHLLWPIGVLHLWVHTDSHAHGEKLVSFLVLHHIIERACSSYGCTWPIRRM